jgi:F-type H+-transporting ATPase subunit a
MTSDKLDALLSFLSHHVMRHAGTADAWNLPFVHIDALDLFHYDAVMLGVVLLVLLAVGVAVRRSYGRSPVPRGFAAAIEAYVLFIRDHIVYENFGEKEGKRFVSFFCTLFIFILTANLLGLIPLFSTATGNVNVTAALAILFMVLSLGAVVRLRGLRGLKAAFVPAGLPGALRGPMMVMEVVSFVSRVFALCIRLFANMMAGHMVIYSMTGMVVVFGWVAFPALLMAGAMYAFELFMAFLQAYVFTLLSAIFMNMMVNPEHG